MRISSASIWPTLRNSSMCSGFETMYIRMTRETRSQCAASAQYTAPERRPPSAGS